MATRFCSFMTSPERGMLGMGLLNHYREFSRWVHEQNVRPK
jgi:hypothetical protein